MATPLIQPSFAAGELAPALHARVDLAKYHVGLATCLNWFIQPQGGAVTRAGTRFVESVLDHATRSRLIPFQFNTEQAYALEFGHLKMRVIRNGGYVLEAAKAITGITQANPAVVTSNAHGFSNGDKVFISGVAGMVQVNGRYFTVAGATANTFQLSGVDSTGYTAYSAGGTVARVFTLATPYAAADLPTLKYMQSADTMTLTHPGYQPRDLTRSAHDSWSLSAITFAAEQAAPTNINATPSSVSTDRDYEYVVTAISAATGEESLPSAIETVQFKNDFTWNPATGDEIHLDWDNAAGAESYNVYRKKNGIFGLVGNSKDGSILRAFVDNKIEPDTTRTPPTAKNPFDAANKYPGCATYHEERRWFAGSNTQPQTIWATQSGNYRNATSGRPAEAALLAALRRSTHAWTCLVDGAPVCIWGVGPLSLVAGKGCPWLLGTEAIERHPMTFLRQSRTFLEIMLETYGELENHVDVRNRLSIRWLRWLGFTIEPAAPYGFLGLPFHRFHMERADV